jgi:short-subunit dehydrogenase
MRIRLKPLHEQVIVIVGASSGTGLATARLAASRGARLVLAGRSELALRQLAHDIRAAAGDAIAVVADVTSQDEVARVADEALRAFGHFDTWINNAAVSAYGRCLEVSLQDMQRIMDTNFWGMVYGARVACAHLQRRGGALINVGSIVSDRAVPLQGIYSASKHAIKGWTDSLRTELAHDHAPISVTLIKPAAIDTPYAEHAMNYLADQPTHTAPVYSPRSVASAILYAAEHPTRELVVGGAGKLLSIAGFIAPRLTDVLMSRLLLPAMHSGRPRRGHPTLYQPGEELREAGDYRGLVRRSVYTELAMHPRLARLAALTATISIGLLWRRAAQTTSAAGTDFPNTRRSTVRAAQ